jgi:hypothetical protein
VSFAAITLCVASQRVFIVVVFRYRLSPETIGYTLVHTHVAEINYTTSNWTGAKKSFIQTGCQLSMPLTNGILTWTTLLVRTSFAILVEQWSQSSLCDASAHKMLSRDESSF